jgi:PAS domain S-box-containing protein
MRFDDPETKRDAQQAVLELAADASFAIDEHEILISCNAAFERHFGYGPGHAIGKPITTLLPTLHHPRSQDEGVAESYIDGQRKDGSRFPVRVRTKCVSSTGRGLVVGVAWPMGLADEKLRETEGMLQAVADASPAVIYIKDVEGRYIFVNRRYEELFHVKTNLMRGKTDHELFPKEIADAVRGNDHNVVIRRVAVEYDETVPSDGEPRQYISIKFPLIHSSGDVYAICGISTDITERNRAEERLQETYKQLQMLVADQTSDLSNARKRLHAESARREELLRELGNLIATAHEGIWTLDAGGRTTFVNTRMAEMLGYTVEEMLGKSFYDFMDAEQREQAAYNLVRRLEGIAEQHDFQFRRKNGASVWTIVSSNPIRGSDGQIIGALGMVTDITDRKRAEEQQKLLLQELDHRVKNNLAIIQGLAELTMHNAGSIEQFAESFGARVQAVARTHEALARARWGDVDMGELVTVVLAAHVGASPGTVVAHGEALTVPARVTTPLALVLNELGANALKHGALSGSGGDIRIDWRRIDRDLLELTWSELHQNPYSSPRREGTGSRLMRGLVRYELNGTLEITQEADRLECRIVIPIALREIGEETVARAEDGEAAN